MFNLFRRSKKVQIPPNDPEPGLYQGVWEKKRQPSPGAQAYAWESLGLPPFTPIGASINTRSPIVPLPNGPQPYVGQAVPLNGMPTTAGQIVGQPLYNPNTGYGGNPAFTLNIPFPETDQPYAGKIL